MLHNTLRLFLNKEKVTTALDVGGRQRSLTTVTLFVSLFLADSGVDPVEWAAKLEDRFYNNHAFKTTQVQHQQ